MIPERSRVWPLLTRRRIGEHAIGVLPIPWSAMDWPGLGYPQPVDRLAQEGKGKLAALAQNYAELANSLKFCSLAMAALDVPLLLKWTNCVTGWDMDAEEFLRVGERNFNLKRLLNLSCGLTGADDTLPYRFTHEPFQSGVLPDLFPTCPRC